MAMAVKMKIIAKDIVKPSSPTPKHLKIFNLCVLDQLSSVGYGSLVLFYSNNYLNSMIIHGESLNDPVEKLKKSLSRTLTKLYPLAGRVKDDAAIVDCDDGGVVFVEARIKSSLPVFLQKPDAKEVRKLIPVEVSSPEARVKCLLQVQLTLFGCGGFAVGICVSRKISDASTLVTFIKNWAADTAALGTSGNNDEVQALFNASSIFPSQSFSFPERAAATELKQESCVTRRFVFGGSEIDALKAKSVSDDHDERALRDPTRVEAVTGLIWRCAMNASRSSNGEHPSRLSILSQSVSIRPMIVPPPPENTIANLSGHFAADATDTEVELKDVVGQLREAMNQFNEEYMKKLQQKDTFSAISESFTEAEKLQTEENIDFYESTSFCRFPFYEVDFGWGKPCWVTIPPTGIHKNVIVMMDTKDGDGIEAWVTLNEEEMVFFERDEDLLSVVSENPNAFTSKFSMLMSSL